MYLTVRDVAELSRSHERTVRRAITDGRLPAFWHGGRLRIRESDAVAWVEAVPVVADRPRPARQSAARNSVLRGSFADLMDIDRRAAE